MSKKRDHKKHLAGTPGHLVGTPVSSPASSGNVTAGFVLAAIVLTFLTVLPPPPVWTATYTVSTVYGIGYGSLDWAVSTAGPGDTIDFAVTPSTVTLSTTLPTISANNLIIDGSNGGSPVTIDGGGLYQIFAFDGGVNSFNLANITLRNGKADYGGAMSLQSTTALTNSGNTTFTGNQADNGGAICNASGLTITNTGTLTFTGNTANTMGGQGGAIYANGDVSIGSGATFSTNAAYQGGAVFVGSLGTQLSLDGTTFQNNLATASTISGAGGAIYFSIPPSTLTNAGNTTFSANTASTGGGAIYADGSLTLTSTTTGQLSFIGNSTLSTTGRGGAIYARQTLYLTSAVDGLVAFANNTATTGGAIYALNLLSMGSTVQTTFTNNTASDVGGAVYAANVQLPTTTGQVTFIDNSATHGGAIYQALGGTTFGAPGAVFQNNTATGQGGAIYAVAPNVNVAGALFGGTSTTQGNSAAFGGAIYLASTSAAQLVLNGTTFQNNTASTGGAVYLASTTTLAYGGGINSTFTDNRATGGTGGAIYAAGDLTLTNSAGSMLTFTGSTAASAGGAIYAAGNVDIGSGVTFSTNSAFNGGAIYLGPASTQLVIEGTPFENNSATGSGGAIHFANTALSTLVNTANSEITNNTAVTNGGAIFAAGDLILADNSSSVQLNFIGNTASGAGGAIYATGDLSVGYNINFGYSPITTTSGGNSATHGGAIALSGTQLQFTGGTAIQHSTAAAGGGAIYFATSSPTTLINSGYLGLFDNTADSGGAILANGPLTLTASTTTSSMIFSNNTATTAGGAIYTVGALTFTGPGSFTFSDNSTATTTASGTIHAGGNVTLDGGTRLQSGIDTEIETPNFILQDGAVLDFNLQYAVDGTSTHLVITGAVTNNLDTAVELTAWKAGTFTLMTATGGGIDTGTFTIDNSDFRYSKELDVTANALTLITSFNNFNLTWTGALSANWTSTGTLPNTSWIRDDNLDLIIFQDGDFVTFTEDGLIKDIVIGTSIEVSGMEITGGEYTFSGRGLRFVNGSSQTLTNAGTTIFQNNTGWTGSYDGGAIYSTGDLTIDNAVGASLTFTGGSPSASSSNGGAIRAGGNLTIGPGVTFSTNSARGGGAITFAGTLTLNGTLIQDNTATNQGGALYVSGSTGTVTLANAGSAPSRLLGNTATASGGAVYVNTRLNVGPGFVFSSNAAAQGGAIAFGTGTQSTQLALNGTTFQNNTATTGGAVQFARTTGALTLTNSGNTTFTDNAAISRGGAIYAATSGVLTLTGSGSIAFSGNTAAQGGAIYAVGNIILDGGLTLRSDIDTDIWTPTFIINSGAILDFDLTNATGTTTNLTITGAVSNFGHDTTVQLSGMKAGTFTLMTATTTGGIVLGDYTLDTSTFSLRQSANLDVVANALIVTTAIGNIDLTWTGATDNVWNLTAENWEDAASTPDSFYHGDSVKFTAAGANQNVSILSGGAQVAGMEITGGNYTFSGGGVRFMDTGPSTLTNAGNTTFTNNTATTSGGAIYAAGPITLANTGALAFIGNTTSTTSGMGGAVYAAGNVDIGSGVTFSTNSAYRGGVIYLGTASTQLALNGATFQNNTATDRGGTLYTESTTFAMTNSGNTTFIDNTADLGAVIFVQSGTVTLTNNAGGSLAFVGNEAGSSGGAIYAGDHLTIGPGVTFGGTATTQGNTAGRGGAIYLGSFAATQLSLDGTTFQNNLATNQGGAVCFFASANATLTNADTTTFTNNTATNQGGAIYAGGVLTLAGTGTIAFSGNAATQGGDIYAVGNVTLDTGITIRSDIDTEIWTPALVINNGVTLEFDLTSATATTTNLAVTGTVNNVSHDTNIVLPHWEVGTFTLMIASGGGIVVADYTVDDSSYGSRQLAMLSGNANTLILTTTSSGNLNLVWTGATNGNWNTTATGNWASGEMFNPDDYVTFDSIATTQTVTVGNGLGVQIAGMEITGGSYTFNGNTIRGVVSTANGQTVTGKLQVAGGSATFNNEIDFVNGIDLVAANAVFNNSVTATAGMTVDAGSEAVFGGSARTNSVTIANAGTVVYTHLAGTITQTGSVTGTGGISVIGSGTLRLDAAVMQGTLTQMNGVVELAAGRNWNGNYSQIAGTLVAGNGTTIIGNVSLTDTVNLGTTAATDVFTITGSLTLDGATLICDLGTSNASDKIVVTGTVSHGATSTIELPTWEVGSFTLLTAAGGIDDTKFFIDTSSYGSRQSATLSVTANTLILTTASTGSLDLVWTGGADGDWNTTTIGNWASGETFNPNDYVTFNAASTTQSITVGNGMGVQVSGMEITGGNYTFSGNTIRGVVSTSSGQTVTGKLTVSGGAATFDNELDFANGVDLTGGSARFNHSVTSIAGITVGAGATAFFGGATRNNTTAMANSGNAVFDTAAGTTLTQTGNVTGTGAVTKIGDGTLTLDASVMGTGSLYHNEGFVELTAARTWAGNYVQQSMGTFVAGNGSTISGNANFAGTVDLEGVLYVGSLTLDGATLLIDLSGGGVSDDIVSSGAVTFGAISTIELSTWETGTFTLLTASGGIDVTKFVVDSSSYGSRQSATLSVAANSLFLTTTSGGNRDLVWTGGTDGHWNTTATGNWASGEMFNPEDYVIFDGSVANKIVTIDNAIRVSGMEITDSGYEFYGETIYGVVSTSSGQTVTGKLVVSGSGSATFANDIDFAGGIELIGGNAQFDNSVTSAAGMTVGSGSRAVFGGTMTRSNAIDIANSGNVLFGNVGGTLTQTGNITGTGSVTKFGNGMLRLDAAAMQGDFIQEAGTVQLAAGRTWTGDYDQSTGTLQAENDARITGDAFFAGTVGLSGALHLGGATTFSGSDATLTGSGSLVVSNGVGTVSVENGATIIPGTGTPTTLVVDGNLHLDGAVLALGLATGGVSDSVTVSGHVSFGGNVNTVNLKNWETGLFTILQAASMDPIDGQWTMKYFGATVDPTKAQLVFDGSSLKLETDYTPPTTPIIVEWDGAVVTDPRGIVWDKDSVDDGVFIVIDLPETELITLDDELSVLAGMEISTDVVIRPIRKGGRGLIRGEANPDLAFLESNGRMAILGGVVELDVETDFENGNLLGNSIIIPGQDKTFGSFEQDSDDIENSRGQIIVQENAEATIAPKKSLGVKNRYVLKQGAGLTIDIADGEELNINGVNVVDTSDPQNLLNGGAIALLAGSTLTLSGNINITGNSTGLAGGGLYMDPSTVIFDSSKGHVAIFGNVDESGPNAIALDGPDNIMVFIGEKNAQSGWSGGVVIADSVRALTGSTNNVIDISYTDPADFVQFGKATHTLGNFSVVSVDSGTMRLVDGATFDVGFGGLVDVDTDGTLAGGGTFIATSFNVLGMLRPDAAALTTTSSIIDSDDLVGTMTLEGGVELDGARIAVELKNNNVSDLVDVQGRLTYTAAKNTVDVNSWSEGEFTVLQTTNAVDVDTSRFALKFGGEEIGSRQTARLFEDANLLKVETFMNNADRRRLTWTADADMFLGTASVGNWVDDFGTAERFNHTDYLVFDATGKQGIITLGAADGSIGGRTVSGMLISDGNYTFIGGDLFGVRSTFDYGGVTSDVGGDLLIAGGNVGFENNVYFEGNIEISNRANVTLAGRRAFHTEGDFILGTLASLTLDVGDDLIKAKTVSLYGTVSLMNEPLPTTHRSPVFNNVIVATDGGLDTGRLQTQFNFTEGLLNRRVSTDGTSMSLQYTATPLTEYATEFAFAHNETEVARYLEQMFDSWEWEDFELDLMRMNDPQLAGVLALLSNSVLYAEANTLALSNPYRAVSQHFFEADDNLQTIDPRHRRCGCSTQGFWIASNHSDRRQDGDSQARQYGVSRTGMNLGLDQPITRSLAVGLLVDYSTPYLYQEGGRVRADDRTFGVYAKKRFADYWEANAFFAFGNQTYRGDRPTPEGTARAAYDGDSWFATGELIRRLVLSKEFTLLPTLAIDFQGVQTDAFAETGSAFRQVYEKSELNRTVLRFGLNTQWRMTDRVRLDTRLQYGRQVGGTDTPSIRGVFAESSVATPMTFHGVNLGRDQLNVGVGGRYFLTNAKRSLVYGNYDLDRGNRSLAHTAELGFQYWR